jgi:hypothetical protein
MYGTVTLATESLRRAGITDPRAHLVIVRNMNIANRKEEAPDGVGTLLLSASPFAPAEIARVEQLARDLAFEVMLTPERSADPLFEQLTGPNAQAVMASFPLKIEPPTDNSPFFFNMLRLKDLFRFDLLEAGKQSNNLKAVATLGILLATVLVLTTLCIFVPLWWRRDVARGARPLAIFFLAIGAGFMLVETSQMERLIISLGHPTYALSVVLFGLLISSGLGSFLTSSVSDDRLRGAGMTRLAASIGVLIVAGAVTPWLVRVTAAGATPVRIAAAFASLFPIGLGMGMAFPLGMRLAARRAADLTPWLWGLNGAASVLSSVLSICIALSWSISAAFWTGCAAYVVALLAFRKAAA